MVCDEAHKMSATVFGGEVKYTRRYRLGQLLSGLTRHFLLKNDLSWRFWTADAFAPALLPPVNAIEVILTIWHLLEVADGERIALR